MSILLITGTQQHGNKSMEYLTYTIKAWYGTKMVSLNVVAVSIESALVDVSEAYGKFDMYQVSIKG